MIDATDQRIHARFWSKVDTTGPCWEWTAMKSRYGYGMFAVTHTTQRHAHRISWELLVGPIPEGLVIDHLCRNKICVNPDHLEPVTNEVNIKRAFPGALNANKTRCPKGHQYDDENTYRKVTPQGWNARVCRECMRASLRKYNARIRREQELVREGEHECPDCGIKFERAHAIYMHRARRHDYKGRERRRQEREL